MLESALAHRDVQAVCQARVTVVTDDGRVAGVRADTGGGTRAIRARAGVVLAAGGFENSRELCDAYLPVGSVQAISHPENTGDGLLVAQAVARPHGT